MQFLNKLIGFLGKKNYQVDKNLGLRDILMIVTGRAFSLMRGLFLKVRLKKSEGMIFLGRRCSIKYTHKIKAGRTLTIGNNVEINALCIEGITFGNNVSILRNTIIECTGVIRELGIGLKVGNNVGIAQNCFIQVRGKVEIGSDVMIGPGVSIFSENHNSKGVDQPMIYQGETRKGVIIEDDVWIGARAVILDGVRVGKGSIVAAGAVVNRDVAQFTIVGGVPAKLLNNR